MHDLGYIVTGYAATAAVIGGYRWRLAIRGRRARQIVDALSGRTARDNATATGPRRGRR